MKVKYRNCEIECTRDKSPFGYTLLFYSVFDIAAHNPGLEITSGCSEVSDTVREYIEHLKEIVDDYIKDPDGYV